MVCYEDGSSLAQNDAGSPSFNQEAQEVPFKAIDWPNVKQLRLESEFGHTTYDIAQPGPEFQISLRRRTFFTLHEQMVSMFVLLVSTIGAEVDKDSTVSAHYWLPNLVEHSCPDFDCADIRKYAVQLFNGDAPALMPATEHLHIAAAVVTE